MSCLQVRERFSVAWDGMLAGGERETFERHLAGCPGCRTQWECYGRTLADLGGFFHRVADAEYPRRPFPRPEPRTVAPAFSWLRLGALVAAGAAAGFAGFAVSAGWRGSSTPGPAAVAVSRPERACPWQRASLAEVSTAVSYPVVADPCLGQAFELVEASIARGVPCPERVRLTYRDGSRTMTLEQHQEHNAASCPGERVELGDSLGCMEGGAAGHTALSWSHGQHGFRLVGDVGPAEALQVARSISDSFEGF